MESAPKVFCLHHATTDQKVDHVMTVKQSQLLSYFLTSFNALLNICLRWMPGYHTRNFPCAVQKVRVVRMHLLHLVKQHELSSSFLIQLKGSDMVQT